MQKLKGYRNERSPPTGSVRYPRRVALGGAYDAGLQVPVFGLLLSPRPIGSILALKRPFPLRQNSPAVTVVERESFEGAGKRK
jgi:hypothetical protein